MNRYFFLVVALLAVGLAAAYLYQSHSLIAIRAHLPGSRASVQPMALQAQCGCTVDTDEQFPTTPQQMQQAKAKEKREEAEGEAQDRLVALRLHRLVRVGMPRKQVERIMGESDGEEMPPEPFKGDTAVDADDYGDYEVAFSAKDTVVWVRPL